MSQLLRTLLSALFLCLLSLMVLACGPTRSGGGDDDDDDSAGDDDDSAGDDDDSTGTHSACGYPDGAADFGTDVGDLLPNIFVMNQFEEMIPIESFCGEVLVIHIDAPWNGAFFTASSYLTDLYNKLAPSGLSVMGALFDVDGPGELGDLAKDVSYPLTMIETSDVENLEVSAIPHLTVVDSEMRILCNEGCYDGLSDLLLKHLPH